MYDHRNKMITDINKHTCLLEMTFPDENGFWKKSRIIALLKIGNHHK